jgi:peptidyl-prolyl cis-trans isomerase SurA
MQRLIIIALLCALWVSGAGIIHAQTKASRVDDRIVAVVNDKIITLSQLNARTELTRRQMGLKEISPAQQSSLTRRTLATLVDEELQSQYAAANGIAITRSELQAAKDTAKQAVGLANWETLNRGLGTAAEDKLKAELIWQLIQNRAVKPNVQLGTMEIDRLIEELSKSRARTERELSIIVIPDEPIAGTTSATTPRSRLEALRTDILASANPAEAFATQAKTTSADSSAVAGGLLGWVGPGELPPALENNLENLGEGEISAPISSGNSWALVRVNALRTNTQTLSTQPRTEYQLYLLAATIPSDTKVLSELQKNMKKQVSELTTIADVESTFTDKLPELRKTFGRSTALGWVPAAALQPEVQAAIKNARVGKWTGEVGTRGQLSRLFVANTRQVMPEEVLALRQRVGQNLMNSRTELESRRFVRELRQRAFIDIRL